MKNGSGKRSFLALAMLVWASCGGSSGGNNNGDALGTGGVTTGGGGTGGTPSGSAATGGAGPGATGGSTGGASGGASGGYGGTSGGYGGSGGTPSVCSDPAYPVSCPAIPPDVPAICWSAGTACSTITKCGDQFRSCNDPSFHYDCTSNTCVKPTSGDGGAVADCPDMLYPVACPSRGDVPALCWSPGTVCSTINRCGNDFKSCQAAGYTFSCTANMCVRDSAPPPDAGVAADAAAPPADAAPTAASADAATHD